MSCQRQILGVKWRDHVMNSDTAATTSAERQRYHSEEATRTIQSRDANTPAHQILRQAVDVKSPSGKDC